MDKNIAYVHDVSLDYDGGAEISGRTMVKTGRALGYNVQVFDVHIPPDQFGSLHDYDFIILSNVWRFWPAAMTIIMDVIRVIPYVKYEHDHDGLSATPQAYPKTEYAEKIYSNSVLNIFVSPDHLEDYAGLGQGICIPEPVDTEMFVPVEGVKREPNSVLVVVPGKWNQSELAQYIARSSGLKVDVLDHKIPHADMPALYSQYETIAHYPSQKWPCDRVIFEAALCGCKIDAGKIVEALSWKRDLTDQKGLRSWLKEVPGQFWGTIGELIKL